MMLVWFFGAPLTLATPALWLEYMAAFYGVPKR